MGQQPKGRQVANDDITITGWDHAEHSERLNPVEVRDVTPSPSDDYQAIKDWDDQDKGQQPKGAWYADTKDEPGGEGSA